MIEYSSILTVKCLRKICRIYKIKIDKCSKCFILDILNKYSAAKVIQQRFRKTLDLITSVQFHTKKLGIHGYVLKTIISIFITILTLL